MNYRKLLFFVLSQIVLGQMLCFDLSASVDSNIVVEQERNTRNSIEEVIEKSENNFDFKKEANKIIINFSVDKLIELFNNCPDYFVSEEGYADLDKVRNENKLLIDKVHDKFEQLSLDLRLEVRSKVRLGAIALVCDLFTININSPCYIAVTDFEETIKNVRQHIESNPGKFVSAIINQYETAKQALNKRAQNSVCGGFQRYKKLILDFKPKRKICIPRSQYEELLEMTRGRLDKDWVSNFYEPKLEKPVINKRESVVVSPKPVVKSEPVVEAKQNIQNNENQLDESNEIESAEDSDDNLTELNPKNSLNGKEKIEKPVIESELVVGVQQNTKNNKIIEIKSVKDTIPAVAPDKNIPLRDLEISDDLEEIDGTPVVKDESSDAEVLDKNIPLNGGNNSYNSGEDLLHEYNDSPSPVKKHVALLALLLAGGGAFLYYFVKYQQKPVPVPA
jgi:hypothetical protein